MSGQGSGFSWSKTKAAVAGGPAADDAKVLPFPSRRRYAFVAALASQMLARSPAEAEHHLAQQLKRQADVLQRIGVSERRIFREVAALEAAVRTVLWRYFFLTPERR